MAEAFRRARKKKRQEDDMSKLIITTVGTSIISNELYDSRFKNEITALVERGTIPRSYNEIVDSAVDTILNNLNNPRPNKQLSAELASLRAFKNNSTLGISKDDVVVLLSTDTEDGKLCAEINKKVLEDLKWCQVLSPIVIKGLKTKRIKENEDISESFKDAGLVELKQETERLLNGQIYTEKYFNITGGFKATIPFITILAFEKKISLFYLYEESKDLIVIDPPQGFICSFEVMRGVTRIRREVLA